ncbi:MAG: DUF452 family protein [Muribaculaceae bacterium]|nr:DUF452 family protein [Muribaculaceae bacterium]
MKLEFINRENHGRLILIFTGWSTDPSFYSHIRLSGWDTLVAWDYSDFNFPEKILDGYHTIALFAWSLGVYAASRSLHFEKIALAIAINGTEHPVEDNNGIPTAIYQGTVSSLNERNLIKFRKRMADLQYAEIADKFSNSDIEDLRKELQSIARDYSANRNEEKQTKWHRVFISSNDRIFPPEAQLRAWENHSSKPVIVRLDTPHYIDIFTVVKSLLPNKEKVGARFEKSHLTYNSEASAQSHIAHELMRATADFVGEKKLAHAAEIGAGTGFFTKLFCQYFAPEEMDIIDLYPLPRFKCSSIENYYVADAEEWMEDKAKEQSGIYDAIVASSAMQWFSNPERFIRNAAKLLKPDGFIALSTFLPGNLAELEHINPYSLPYRKQEDLERMIKKRFHSTFFNNEKIKLNFNSGRELLRHISHTGVGGTGTTYFSLKELLLRLPQTLTYHPLYIIGVQPEQTV